MSRSAILTDNFQAYVSGNYLDEADSNWDLVASVIRITDVGAGALQVACGFSGMALAMMQASVSADQYAKIAIKNMGNIDSGTHSGISVRTSATAQDTNVYAYIFYFEHTAASGNLVNTVLARIDNGTPSVLHQESVTWAINDTIEMEVSGTGATVTLACFKNGTQLTNFNTADTSGSRLTTGKPGIYSKAAAAFGFMDDFEGGTVTASATNWGRLLGMETNRLVRGVG